MKSTRKGADGSRFANQGECVRYASRGGTLVPSTATVTITFDPTHDPSYCVPIVHVSGFLPNTTYTVENYRFSDLQTTREITTDSAGNYEPFGMGFSTLEGNVVRSVVGGVSSETVRVAC